MLIVLFCFLQCAIWLATVGYATPRVVQPTPAAFSRQPTNCSVYVKYILISPITKYFKHEFVARFLIKRTTMLLTAVPTRHGYASRPVVELQQNMWGALPFPSPPPPPPFPFPSPAFLSLPLPSFHPSPFRG